MTKLIIFDLDGTLLDTPRSIAEAFNATLTGMQLEPFNPEVIKKTIGIPLEVAFSKLLNLPTDHEKTSAAVLKYQSFYKEMILPKAKELLFDDVQTGLSNLKESGYKLAVVTNKIYQSAVSILTSANIYDHFDIVLGADQVLNRKPHPEGINLVLKTLACLPESALMVGDTNHDINMAKNAGVKSIAVTYGVSSKEELSLCQPTWIVDEFSGLLKIIKENMNAETI